MLVELQLLALCLDLFMAGSETTSNTLGFATAYMLLHPDIQDRVHQELDREVGRERQPALQDRARLSYIEAVLMEVQRHGNVVPVAVAHRATRTADLMGHIIPQGATLLVSLHSLHMDPTHWGDPDTFRPERFLDAQGKLLQDDWFLPFGVELAPLGSKECQGWLCCVPGKRRCLGETLARSTLFLFFTTLLHNFTLSVPPKGSLPSTKGYDGVTISPRPFFAVLTPRGPEGGSVPGADDTWNFCKIPVKNRKMEFLAKVSPMHRLRPDNTMFSLSAGSKLVHQEGALRVSHSLLMSFDSMKPRLGGNDRVSSRGNHYLLVQWQQCKV
uniref:Cytochrome P450 n=1 Tax=Timema tahoe TaxID=61484 RepID=A0A7R9FHU0_9NEOP|nr:unnamed protein product [Timema tahoe]